MHHGMHWGRENKGIAARGRVAHTDEVLSRQMSACPAQKGQAWTHFSVTCDSTRRYPGRVKCGQNVPGKLAQAGITGDESSNDTSQQVLPRCMQNPSLSESVRYRAWPHMARHAHTSHSVRFCPFGLAVTATHAQPPLSTSFQRLVGHNMSTPIFARQ